MEIQQIVKNIGLIKFLKNENNKTKYIDIKLSKRSELFKKIFSIHTKIKAGF